MVDNYGVAEMQEREGGHFIPSKGALGALSLLWHKRAGVSNTSDMILDFEWTSLEARERERDHATLYLTLLYPIIFPRYFLLATVSPVLTTSQRHTAPAGEYDVELVNASV